jgi:hypothetical protein
MAKGRDKQGREKKKKKKAKGAGAPEADLQFRHHSVVMNQPPPQAPATPPRVGE